MDKSRLLILAGAFFLIIGGFLPWISVPDLFGLHGAAFEGIEVGWEGDGTLTAAAGLLLLFGELLYGRKAGWSLILTGAALALFGLMVIFFDIHLIVEIGPRTSFLESIDSGFYLTFAGSLTALAGCLGKLGSVLKRREAKAVGKVS